MTSYSYGSCYLCGKPTIAPNAVLSKGRPYHIGCAMDELDRLMLRYTRILDYFICQGTYGPWSDREDNLPLGKWDEKDEMYMSASMRRDAEEK